MIENLPRNGSFIERKKVFVEYPFHSLNHHAPFQWPEDRSSQEKLRVKNRPSYEQEYIRRLYNDKMQRKLNAKFNAPQDSFRAIPNQITAKRDEEALNREIQHFNKSKTLTNNNPESQQNLNENSQPLQRSYQSAKQINKKPSVDQHYYAPQLYGNKNQLYDLNQNSKELNRSENSEEKEMERAQMQEPISPRYAKLSTNDYKDQRQDVYRRPYMTKNYGSESLQNHQSYAELINSSNGQPPIRPLRNYLPDQLQGYLRQNLRVQRKRPTNNSISLQTRLKL